MHITLKIHSRPLRLLILEADHWFGGGMADFASLPPFTVSPSRSVHSCLLVGGRSYMHVDTCYNV